MISRVHVSLKVKLSLLITSLVVLTVALVSFLLLRQQQHSLTEQMVRRGHTIAEHLAAAGKGALVANDDLTLHVLVKEAMKDPDVAYVAFVDDDSNVRAHSDINAVGSPLARPASLKKLADAPLVQTYRSGGRDLIDFSVPLVFSQVPVGGLYVGFSKATIAAALTSARNRATLITVALVAIGVAGAVGLATVLSRPIFRLVAGTRAIAEGNFQINLPVTSSDEIGTLTESFNQMARSLREKEMIKRAFTRYVAREVVEEVLKDPEQLGLTGERREVTVLFCDIRGFTSVAERLSPEEVVILLNEFYTLMIETTFKHDGTLDKFLGDAVMAVFGAPIAHPDHAIRAVRTAIDMRNGIAELNERRVTQGKVPIGIGVGLSLGEVVAGTVGTEDRMEYTVIGDSVNLAARLVDQARPAGRILISQRTYEAVREFVDVKDLGPLKVKGKEEEVEVYEVLSLHLPA